MDEMIEQVAPVKVSLDDLDDLINALSPEELSELSMVDPDDSSMPANMRCIYDCGKDGTNVMDREKMMKQLQQEALATPDKEDPVEFVPGTIRGKKYVPKDNDIVVRKDSDSEEDEEPAPPSRFDDAEEEERNREYSEALGAATLTDLMEIADILGVTYQDHCSATQLKVFPKEEPNDTDINKVIEKVEGNSDDCLEINLNNIQGIPQSTWLKFFEVLAANTTVELLTATNCDLTDTMGAAIASCLERNKALKYLTLDSNNISGDMLVKIIRATAQTKVLEELRCSNQLNCKYLGHRIEKEIADVLAMTPQLVKLGVTMEFRDSLNRTAIQLQKNLDKRRLTEDRTFTLKLDKKHGPSIVEEKSKM